MRLRRSRSIVMHCRVTDTDDRLCREPRERRRGRLSELGHRQHAAGEQPHRRTHGDVARVHDVQRHEQRVQVTMAIEGTTVKSRTIKPAAPLLTTRVTVH